MQRRVQQEQHLQACQPGVTGSWTSNVVTITGTPTTTAGSPFNYTVTLTGGCGNTSISGSITVITGNTITLSSAARN